MAISNKKIILTKEGLANLQREYQELINQKRPAVINRISRAREFGDLSENSEYDAAKEEQTLLEVRITQLEQVLKNFQIVKDVQETDIVVIGSTIVVEINDEVHEFTLVGSMEANPAAKKISNESPVGKALLGLKAGESAEVAISPVKSRIKVMEIK